MKTMMRNTSRGQRGFTLIEALIAFVVLAGGLLAAFRFHTTTMAVTAESKIRSEAVALAEQKLEELRSYFGVNEANVNDFDVDLPSSTNADFLAEVNTAENLPAVFAADGYAANFTRNWSVRGANPRQVDVRVSWVDRENNAQRVQLSTLIWETIPANSAAQFASALTNTSTGTNVWNGGGGGGAPGFVVAETDANDGAIVDAYGNPILDGNGDPVVATTFRVTFTGSYTTTNGANLIGVALTKTAGTQTGATCSFSASDYTCIISGVAINDTWDGVITFNSTAAGNAEGVCELIGSNATVGVDTALLSINKNSSSLATVSTPDISAIRVVKKASVGAGGDC